MTVVLQTVARTKALQLMMMETMIVLQKLLILIMLVLLVLLVLLDSLLVLVSLSASLLVSLLVLVAASCCCSCCSCCGFCGHYCGWRSCRKSPRRAPASPRTVLTALLSCRPIPAFESRELSHRRLTVCDGLGSGRAQATICAADLAAGGRQPGAGLPNRICYCSLPLPLHRSWPGWSNRCQ